MNRRNFLTSLGILGVGVIAAPSVLAETFEFYHFNPRLEYGEALMCPGVEKWTPERQKDAKFILDSSMKEVIPPGYRQKVKYIFKTMRDEPELRPPVSQPSASAAWVYDGRSL